MPKGVRNVIHGTRSGYNQHRRRKEDDCATCAASRTRRRSGSPVVCGSASGVRAHRRRGEKPCRPCQEAKNAQNRGLYAANHADVQPRPKAPRVTVKRQFEVECWDTSCERVIDVAGTRADADTARRQHIEDHRTGRLDPPEPLGVTR